jgi:lipid-A-disaccharide synthase
LLDAIGDKESIREEEFRKKNNLDPRKKIIALLPGSRRQEVEKMLSVMLSVVPKFPSYEFVIAAAPSLDETVYSPFLGNQQVSCLRNQTYPLLQCSHAALVTSGTATLETALFKVPQVVCYRGSWVSYQIAKRIITLKYISLVNLIMDKEVVKELIQDNLNNSTLTKELQDILSGPKRSTMLAEYDALEEKLGGGGASSKAAKKIVGLLRNSAK